MPSTLLGSVSGGALLVSGNPFATTSTSYVPHGIVLKLGSISSGNVYVGITSGAVALGSGGFLSSGGMQDGFEMRPNDILELPLPPQGIAGVRVAVPPAASGTCRMFWRVQ